MAIRMSALNLAQYPPAHLIELARLQEACGYETFWYTDERFFREVYSGLTLAAVHTQHIQLGTMVTDPYTRHPALTAMAIATLDEVAQGRAVLGLGAGVAGFTELQLTRRQPVQAMRETVTVVRRLLSGATVDMQGQVIALTQARLDFQPHCELPCTRPCSLPLSCPGCAGSRGVRRWDVAAAEHLNVSWMMHICTGMHGTKSRKMQRGSILGASESASMPWSKARWRRVVKPSVPAVLDDHPLSSTLTVCNSTTRSQKNPV